MIEFLSSPLANGITLTLLHFLWQGLLVALACWVLLAVAGRRSARVRYGTSLISLSLMAIAPFATFAVVYDSAPATDESTTPVAAASPTTRPEPAVTTHQSSQHPPGTQAASQPHSNSSQTIDNQDAVSNEWTLPATQPFVLFLWMTGVLLSGARLIAGFGNVIWLRWGRTEVAPELVQQSRQIAERLGLATARVFSTQRIREAAVVGFWRPVVLLPTSWLTSLPTDVLEAVIAHELAHIRRYDVWANLLQRIVETLLFYHPAVWWLSNRIRLEREMCCDALAAEITGDRGDYAMALEQVGRLQTQRTTQLSPAFLGDRKMNMLNRVRHVLGMSVKTEREPAWLVGIIALAIPALLVGVTGVHPGLNVAAAQDAAVSPVDKPERPTGADAVPSRTGETAPESGSKKPAPASQTIKRIASASAEGSGGRYQIQTTTTGVVLLDTKTGDSWSLSERDGARVWIPIPRGGAKSTPDESSTDREPVATGDGGMIEFRGATPIRLTLGRRFDSAAIKRISELTTLEEIDARHCIHMRDADLIHFAGLSNLRKLKLPAGIGDAGVQHLAGLTELVQLLFQDATITAAGMEHLKLMVKLEELGFWRCTLLTDEGFNHFESMTSLKSLDLRRCAKLTDEALQQISHLHSLEVLDVGNVPGITDVGLKSIGAMVNLKYLGTVKTAITDFTPVRKFVKLELINVPTNFGDDQIHHLKGLPKLTNIGLDGSQVTDEGMALIGSMKNVRWLAIRDTAVTDAGLASLKGLPLLGYLHLEGTQTTGDQISDLRKHLPHCVVTGPNRQSALLGF